MSKSIQTAMADCTKCRIRHARPVGVRCRRNLNISAPVAEADHSRVQVQFNAQPSTSQPETLPATEMLEGNSSSRASDSSQSGQGPMDSKLDLILRKMEQIEKKNKELEMKLHSNAKGRSVSRLSHSSPKRSHKCSTSCSSHTHKKRRSHGASNMESFFMDLSDLDMGGELDWSGRGKRRTTIFSGRIEESQHKIGRGRSTGGRGQVKCQEKKEKRT